MQCPVQSAPYSVRKKNPPQPLQANLAKFSTFKAYLNKSPGPAARRFANSPNVIWFGDDSIAVQKCGRTVLYPRSRLIVSWLSLQFN